MVFQQRVSRRTRGHGDMQDLTDDLVYLVMQSGMTTGLAQLTVIGSTAAVGTIEFEPGLCEDLPAALDRVLPPGRDYAREQAWGDGNAHSHVQSTILGSSLTLPIAEGRLALGTWQQVFLLECDTRPRDRLLIVTLLGECE